MQKYGRKNFFNKDSAYNYNNLYVAFSKLTSRELIIKYNETFWVLRSNAEKRTSSPTKYVIHNIKFLLLLRAKYCIRHTLSSN